MKLNHANYFSKEAEKKYMSASQVKSFLECEARAMAVINGEFERRPTLAMLVGSYVDAHFSGEMAEFTEAHPEIFNMRTGELKTDFRRADDIIKRIERDPLMMEFLGGDTQTIMTGKLFGQPFKIKMDSYFPGEKIVDLKVMRDMRDAYVDGQRKLFVDAFRYDLQGYIYQQIVKENTGEDLLFYLAVATKEYVPNIDIIHLPNWELNSNEGLLEHYVPRIAAIKEGKEKSHRCGRCDYCKSTKVLTAPREYEDFLETDL